MPPTRTRSCLLSLAALLLGHAAAWGQRVCSVPGGPNHFIVLVDSSGSMSRGSHGAEAQRARTRLTRALFSGKTLGALPRLDPKNDLVSVHEFGIDESSESSHAYARLKFHSLARDYLRTRLLKDRRVTQAQFSKALEPGRRTNLGVQAWARSVGLWASRVSPETPVQRTFLILLTDHEPNGGSSIEEAEGLEHFASPADRQWVKDKRSRVGKQYRFVDADGMEDPLAEAQFGGASPVYLTAYEVIARSRERDEIRAAAIWPVKSADAGWNDESASQPTAHAEVTLSDALDKWLAGRGRNLSASANVADGSGSASGPADKPLTVPMKFKSLPWEPKVGQLELVAEKSDSEPWLGTRWVQARFTTPLVMPQPLTRSLAHLAPIFGVMFLALLAVLGTAWTLWQRRFGRHFGIKPPGFSNPIPLPAVGQTAPPRREAAPLAPNQHPEAFRIRLPHPLIRWLFYRDAVVSLGTLGGKVKWVGQKELDVPLAAFGKEAVAVWTEFPTITAQADVEIRRGEQISRAEMIYPRPAPPAKVEAKMAKYYVALDLGSDSMAACYDIDGEPKMVPLQHFAPYVMVAEPDYLSEGGKVSKRLRSQVTLRNNQPAPDLDDAHMRLEFFDNGGQEPQPKEFDRSIFEFFHSKSGPPDVNAVLPNPKVMFQYGIHDAFPSAVTSETSPRKMHLTPEIVIEHLTVQILRNLVLGWGPLADIYAREPEEIEVILTIPNVYSVEHAETLRRRVSDALGVGAVSVVSESDAVAYYRRSKLPVTIAEPEAVAAGAQDKVRPALTAADQEPEPPMQILTIDIGRGTTDMSLVRIDNISGRERVTIRARTGRSSGGGELTYLFVRFYEKQVERAFRQLADELLAEKSPEERAAMRWPEVPPVSFRWLSARRFRSDPNFLAGLYGLANLVEKVKRAYGSHQQLSTPADAQGHIETIAQSLVELVKSDHVDDPSWAERYAAELEALRGRIASALTINKVLTTGLRVNSGDAASDRDTVSSSAKGLFLAMKATVLRRPLDLPEPAKAADGKQAAASTPDQDLMWLAAEIEKYVRSNVDDLLAEMAWMVGSSEDRAALGVKDARRRLDMAVSCLVEKGSTYVVVGGQASQFPPIKERLEGIFRRRSTGRSVKDYWHITGSESKEACCQGAVIFKRSRDEVLNPDHLHGSYALVPYARGSDPAAVISTYDLNHHEYTRVETSRDTGRVLVYSPGTLGETIDDSKVSRLGGQLNGQCYDVYYQFDPVAGCRRLRVGDTPIRLQTYSGLKSVIWHKVWPDQLPEEQPQ